MTNFIENLAQSIPSWGAKLAYGDKTTLDGHELVPVAVVIFGFGGGEGSGEKLESSGDLPPGKGEGRGGGGGGYTVPVGAYVGGPEGPTFRPNIIALIAVSIPAISAAGWAISRIVAARR